MKLAVIHFGKGPTPNESDIDLNEERLIELNIQAATKTGADLIVNPEVSILSLSNISSPLRRNSAADNVFKSRQFAKWFAEERCKIFLKRLASEVAIPYKKYIVAGIIRLVPEYNLIYNSAIVLGPDSETRHLYDKHVLTSDVTYAVKGNSELTPARLEIGNIGVMICADYSSPLISRSLALGGSDLIVIPAALSSQTIKTLRVRALENGIPFALSNCFELDEEYKSEDEEDKLKYNSQSAIVSADGTELAKTSDRVDKILSAELDLTGLIAQGLKKKKRDGRLPDLYQGALVDLSDSQLRTTKPQQNEVCIITVSGTKVNDYFADKDLKNSIEKTHSKSIPIVLVLPEFRNEKQALEKHFQFGTNNHLYILCSFLEENFQTITLIGPEGNKILVYKKVHLSFEEKTLNRGNRLECYEDLPFGRVGILSGEDLLYPETIEIYKNAGVELILAASNLDFDEEDIFEDIAKSRKTNIAVADRQYKGGIYTRHPKLEEMDLAKASLNKDFVNILEFNLRIGKPSINVSPSQHKIVTRNLQAY